MSKLCGKTSTDSPTLHKQIKGKGLPYFRGHMRSGDTYFNMKIDMREHFAFWLTFLCSSGAELIYT